MMVKFGMAEGQDGMIFRRTPMGIANVKLQLLAQILNIMEARKQVAWNMMGLRLALISKHFIKSNHLQDAHWNRQKANDVQHEAVSSLWSKIFVFDPLHFKYPLKTGRNSLATASTLETRVELVRGHMQGTIPNGEAMACWGWTSSHHRWRQDNLVVQGYSVLLMDCFWPDFYPFSLEKVLQLLALKLLLSSVLKLCCILWKHHREVSLPLLSIGTTFFLLKSDIFHSDAGKRLILLEKGLNGNCSACGSSFVGLV